MIPKRLWIDRCREGFYATHVTTIDPSTDDQGWDWEMALTVQPVLPGSITISRTEFWAAIHRAGSVYQVDPKLLEIELFGKDN